MTTHLDTLDPAALAALSDLLRQVTAQQPPTVTLRE